ncbi:MAG: M56 family metallopeptidase [Gelidibacter sp.]
MIPFLLKFSACLAIFMVFYKVFLERERMHQLKRFYLLSALVFSAIVPFVIFTTYVESVVTQAIEIPVTSDFYIEPKVVAESINYWPVILWSIYGLGVLLFASKFYINLFKLSRKIKRNEKQKSRQFTYVLLQERNTPHTFFNFIFLNKQQFETQKIPKEVFLHEEAHARQKHSIDVLFVEFLQIIFWFHPLVYWAKHCIKLNHEFLADEAVIKQGIEPSSYQQLLLTFSSPNSYRDVEPQLANAINYSSIKKRFTVMKTHTSKQKIWLSTFLLLPLFALTLYGFSEREIIEKPVALSIDSQVENQHETNSQDPDKDFYYQYATIQFIDAQNNVIATKKYTELTEEEKQQLPAPLKNPAKKTPSQSELDSWLDSKKFGIWVDSKRIKNSELHSFEPSDFGLYYVSKLEKNAVNYGKHYFQVSLYTNKEYDRLYKDGQKPLSEGALIRITKNTPEEKNISKQSGNSEDWKDVEKYLSQDKKVVNAVNIYIDKNNNLTMNGNPVSRENLIKEIDKLNTFLTPEQKRKYVSVSILYEDEKSKPIVDEILNDLKSINIYNAAMANVGSNGKPNLNSYNELSNQGRTIDQAEAEYQKRMISSGITKLNDSLKKSGSPWSVELGGSTVEYVETNGAKEPNDFSIRKVILMASATQTRQLIYMLDGKKSTFSEIESFINKNPDCDVNFQTGKQNVLSFSKNVGKKLSYEDLQKVYSEVFEYYEKDANLVFAKRIEDKDNLTPHESLNSQQFASEEEIKWYNNLIKETNSKPENQRILKQKDIDKLKAIYQKMSDQQKTSSEPFPKFPTQQTKTKEQVKLNGKASEDGIFTMTADELSTVELSIAKGKIKAFKFKVPGKKTVSISGNALNDDVKTLLKDIPIGHAVQLFDIRNSENAVHPPILIEIK